MTLTPPQQQTASSTTVDPAILAAAVDAALKQLGTNSNTGRPIVQTPPFLYDAAKPNSAALWISRLQSLFRLHKLSAEEQCALAINALDDSTYEKLHRALLPADISTLDDFDKFKSTLIGLFDRTESVFAKRYASFQLEWRGPEYESVAEYCSRVREMVSGCDPTKFGENQYQTMVVIMGMKHPALETFRIQALNLLNKDPDTSLEKIQETLTATYRTQQESMLPMGISVNYVKKVPSSKKKHCKRSTSSSSVSSRDSKASSTSSKRGSCDSCGGQHLRTQCKFRNAECYSCGRSGHIKKVCKAKQASTPYNSAPRVTTHHRVNNVQVDQTTLNCSAAPIAYSSNSGTKFHRGDSVQWYDSKYEAWIPGRVMDIFDNVIDIKSGQTHAMLDKSEILPYDPSSLPAPPATDASTPAARKQRK